MINKKISCEREKENQKGFFMTLKLSIKGVSCCYYVYIRKILRTSIYYARKVNIIHVELKRGIRYGI